MYYTLQNADEVILKKCSCLLHLSGSVEAAESIDILFRLEWNTLCRHTTVFRSFDHWLICIRTPPPPSFIFNTWDKKL